MDWFNLKIAKGVYYNKPLTYVTYYAATTRAFDACSVSISKKTHAGRGSGAQHAEIDGATEDQLRWHDHASFVKKRKLDKLDSVYEHCVDKEETDEDTDQHLAGGEVVDDETACENGFTQFPPLSLLLAVQPTTKLPHLTHRDVILTTTDSHAADKATQEDKMMLATLGRWVPVVYNHDNMQYGMLTSSSIASILLSKNQTKGTWCSPTQR
ncbi:hypothetical protein CU097_003957 [Rhizopus azygosporus]|uniref:CBS domain-containing protein n=1 Tax=Rhizopus azygosporus TaxID=86630 RepID=A0A367IWP3_RHIAZ|nr:hypothetical protein CU097_003957 [Rhizopus azygosporus]